MVVKNKIKMSLRTVFLRKKFWLKDWLNGAPMWKAYKEVRLIMADPIKGEEIRQQRLHDLLVFAQTNTPYYQGKNYTHLSDFPVVNKQVIMEHYDQFLTPVDKIPGQKGEVHVQRTSGSTGTPFEVRQDTNCRTRRVATIKAANELIGFHSFEPLMHLRAIKHYWNFPDDVVVKWNKDICILYADNANLTDSRVRKLIDAINEYKISFVRGYMTTLDTITRYAVENNYPILTKPTFISVGELLLDSLRSRVESMGCKIISQYGNEENGVFGQSKINGSGTEMTLYRANCYIEILKMDRDEPVEENELGRIVVTDFTNYSMPMIRYEIGDCAMIGERADNGALLSIKNLSGRKTDMVYRTDGSVIDIFNSMPKEIYNGQLIRQWQFIQKDAKSYVLNLGIKDETVRAQENLYVQYMKDILGPDAEISINWLHEIPVLASGKRKIVIQEYKKK